VVLVDVVETVVLGVVVVSAAWGVWAQMGELMGHEDSFLSATP
jgi:hypothetical protein